MKSLASEMGLRRKTKHSVSECRDLWFQRINALIQHNRLKTCQSVSSIRSGSKPTLVLGIAHDYGAIWDISWCPSGTWEPASSMKNQVCTWTSVNKIKQHNNDITKSVRSIIHSEITIESWIESWNWAFCEDTGPFPITNPYVIVERTISNTHRNVFDYEIQYKGLNALLAR